MKRPDLQIVYRKGRIVALRGDRPEPQPLSAMAAEAGFKVGPLGLRLGVSGRQLQRLFLDSLGISPKDWMRRERMVLARQLLREGRLVREVGADLGFASARDFSREFQAVCGVSPSEFQRRQDHEVNRRLE